MDCPPLPQASGLRLGCTSETCPCIPSSPTPVPTAERNHWRAQTFARGKLFESGSPSKGKPFLKQHLCTRRLLVAIQCTSSRRCQRNCWRPGSASCTLHRLRGSHQDGQLVARSVLVWGLLHRGVSCSDLPGTINII